MLVEPRRPLAKDEASHEAAGARPPVVAPGQLRHLPPVHNNKAADIKNISCRTPANGPIDEGEERRKAVKEALVAHDFVEGRESSFSASLG